MTDTVNLQVSSALVEPIVRAKIEAAIIRELSESGAEELIAKVIEVALGVNVDSDGKQTPYSNGITMIRWLCEKSIRGAAEAAIKAWLEQNRPKLEDSLRKQLEKRNASLAEAMVVGLESAMQTSWRFHLNCEFKSADR